MLRSDIQAGSQQSSVVAVGAQRRTQLRRRWRAMRAVCLASCCLPPCSCASCSSLTPHLGTIRSHVKGTAPSTISPAPLAVCSCCDVCALLRCKSCCCTLPCFPTPVQFLLPSL